ncbi:hypothetical protein [Deinococcus sp.]|uniref:hypothetical protein n=1 Tax=Deinococcus sp. TaxID=47478 RepID=UPI0025C1484D|nr:hypothetical protein [Deinococcus sp.]
MSFSAPSYTQTPNELFALQADMKEAELRVTLAIVRATFGWNAGGQLAHLTLDMLMFDTGLSKQGVMNGVNAGKTRGTLVFLKQGKEVYYGLSISQDGAAAAGAKGQPSRPKLIAPDGQPSRPNEASKGQRSRPTGDGESQRSRPSESTYLTQTVNLVDSDGQPSGPLTPVFPAPSREKTGAQRQLTNRKDTERQTAAEGLDLRTAPAAAVSDGHLNDQDQPSGADRTGTPGGARAANATTGHGITQATANAGQTTATGTEQVPGAPGAALAALVAALAPMDASTLIAETPLRSHWTAIPADQIRELHGTLRAERGGRAYRGALIEALDRAALTIHRAASPAPTTTNVGDLVRARLKGTR